MEHDPRHQFREALSEVEARALDGLELVRRQLELALGAVSRQDTVLAAAVVADDDLVDGRYLEVHQTILSLLATQAPVAGDLRVAAALLHVIHNVERMGDQCVNIAKLVPLSGHHPPHDEELLETIERMGSLLQAQVTLARHAFGARDIAAAEKLARGDAEIDQCNRRIFRRAVEIGDDTDRREWATFMVLVARALERIGDNAVDIGEQAVFVVSGLFRELDDSGAVETP